LKPYRTASGPATGPTCSKSVAQPLHASAVPQFTAKRHHLQAVSHTGIWYDCCGWLTHGPSTKPSRYKWTEHAPLSPKAYIAAAAASRPPASDSVQQKW